MWDAIKDGIFWCIEFFYNFVQDWGLAIIIVTIIFRILLAPLMQKQIKSSYTMQKFSPKIQALQEKYKDDEQRLSQETQKLYAESGFNPVAGCLPMLLQMPIFIALYQTLSSLGERGSDFTFYGIIPDLVSSPSAMFAQGILPFIPYLILLLFFAGLTFAPSLMQLQGQSGPQKNQQIIMMVAMSALMLFIGWGAPAGVLLFWAVSSLFGVLQQRIVTTSLKRKDKEVEEEQVYVKPIEVNVERKVKKAKPKKKH